jgi:hypothetical protein
MISLAIAFVALLVLRQLMDFQNRYRDRQQNVKIDPESESSGVTETAEAVALDADETDWENRSFRYYL